MIASPRCISLIAEFEGFRERAYKDPVGIWTIGYGFIKGVKEGDRMTRAQADLRLQRELSEYEAAVANACTLEPTQNQFDALVCFSWNVGINAMRKSSVIKAHNKGDFNAAARAFGLWNKAGGKVFPGLTRRRAAEAALYLEPIITETRQAMPQLVDPEKPMTDSTINRASIAAGGTAAIATVAETARTISEVKYSVDSLGNWLVPILLVMVVALCGYIVYERLKQRKEGVA